VFNEISNFFLFLVAKKYQFTKSKRILALLSMPITVVLALIFGAVVLMVAYYKKKTDPKVS